MYVLVQCLTASFCCAKTSLLLEITAIRGGATDAVKSIDLLLSDRHLFVATDCETMPRKCECDVAGSKPKAGL